jgi:cell division septal protein FtsQ
MQYRRGTLVSPKLLKQKKQKRITFFSIFLGSTLLIFLLFFFIFRLKFLFITEISITGNQIVESVRVKEVVEEILAEHYFLVIPKKNRLVYPKKEIEYTLRKELGRIENLTMNVNRNLLEITIEERGSYALWCQKEERCFFIDSTGLIFSEAPVFSDGVYQIFSGVVTDSDPVGKNFLDTNLLKDIDMISEFLLQHKLYVEKINVTTPRDVTMVLEGGVNIKIDITKKAVQTVEILKTLFASKDFKKAAPDISNLEYIDVRFGTKVFFKPVQGIQKSSLSVSTI